MTNLVDRIKDGFVSLSTNLGSGLEKFSKDPLKYAGRVALDYVDAVAAVAAGYFVVDLKNILYGKKPTIDPGIELPALSISASLGVFGPYLRKMIERDRNDQNESREEHGFYRNTFAFFSSLIYFWDNGITNLPPLERMSTKLFSVILAIGAYLKDNKRKKTPIIPRPGPIEAFRKVDRQRWQEKIESSHKKP